MKKIKQIFLLILLIGISNISFSYDNNSTTNNLKVLFVGNSLTGFNDLPEMVNQITAGTAYNIICDTHIKYGRSLCSISQSDAFNTKLNSDFWDIIILQDSGIRAAYPDNFHQLTPWIDSEPLQTTMENVKNTVYAINSETKIMMFMPWAFKDGVLWIPGQTDDFFVMQEKIRTNSIDMSNSIGIQIAPVGWAWYKSISQRNDIELFDPDLSHPSLEGSYLGACVFYSTFFQEEVNSNYFASLDSATASFLQGIASLTVLEDLNTWILHAENNSDKPTDISLKQNYPNPFNSSTIIEYNIPETAFVTLSMYDINGIEIKELDKGLRKSGKYRVQFNSNDIPSGVYFYRLTTNSFDYVKKCSLIK